ncbi:MAG: type IIL restriction-modification enzyme MmeI, partial [Burkholderiaceae bacterium]
FTMFAEDIGLLPKRAFADLLEKFRNEPDVLGRLLVELWTAMDRGDFSATLATTVLKFNGKLFKAPEALPLAHGQIDRLLAAAPAALSRDDVAASFTARGRWRERLDPLLDMLVVLGKARVEAGDVPRYRRGG